MDEKTKPISSFIVRLNTLAILLSVIIASGGILIAIYNGFGSRLAQCSGNQVFKEDDPVKHVGNFYDVSEDPPRLLPPDEVLSDEQCANLKSEWKWALALSIGFLFLVHLASATISWLFGSGFRIHFRLKSR